RVWGAPGFLRPEPEPPVVIAALGPKMAEVAGRTGDGINVRASHPRLSELLTVAVDAHARAGRRDAPFLLTVLSGLDDRWRSPQAASTGLAELTALGVHRLILALGAPFDPAAIAEAGRLLCG